MKRQRSAAVTAAGALAAILGHAAAPLHRSDQPLDQATIAAAIADYLLPSQSVELDEIGRLRARYVTRAAAVVGSNTIRPSWPISA
jgi:hypothetical protein